MFVCGSKTQTTTTTTVTVAAAAAAHNHNNAPKRSLKKKEGKRRLFYSRSTFHSAFFFPFSFRIFNPPSHRLSGRQGSGLHCIASKQSGKRFDFGRVVPLGFPVDFRLLLFIFNLYSRSPSSVTRSVDAQANALPTESVLFFIAQQNQEQTYFFL